MKLDIHIERMFISMPGKPLQIFFPKIGFLRRQDVIRKYKENPDLFEEYVLSMGADMSGIKHKLRRNPGFIYDFIEASFFDVTNYLFKKGIYLKEKKEIGFQLSEKDKENIDYLVSMGFDRQRATQAYFHAEKDIDKAVILLIDGVF